MHMYPVYVYPVHVYAMNAINTVRTHAQTHAHSYAYVQNGKGVFDHTMKICCCQTKAWKAGHKGECVAAARADTHTAAKPTADQMPVLKMLEQLAGDADWRGVAAQERAARAVAAAVRTSMPSNALSTAYLASRISRKGTSARPSSTTGSTWRLQKRWATGRGRAWRTGTSALATCT